MTVAAAATVAPGVSADDYVCVALSQLAIGSRLQSPVYDGRPGRQRQLLLSAGKQLAPSYLDNLKRRGIETVLIHRNDWRCISQVAKRRQNLKQSTPRTGRASNKGHVGETTKTSTKPSWAGWKVEPNSFIHQLQPIELPQRDPARMEAFQKSYDAGVKCATSLITILVRERELNTDAAIRVSDQHLREVAEDVDEFLHRGAAPIGSDYPSRHSLQTAMLATSIATIMGYSRDELLELGCGCLLHDAGMLLVSPELLTSTAHLSAVDRLEIQKHPIYSANMLQHLRDVPHAARHIVYQMHERMNGSGYPRGRSGPQIHPLARVAAVADTYLALISPRPFRPALAPYEAIERILFATRQGLLDPGAVRGLLHTISLFPIGSIVTLSDGRAAQVLRANRDEFARPKVQILDPSGKTVPELVDLREERGLVISSVGPGPPISYEPSKHSIPELLAATASL